MARPGELPRPSCSRSAQNLADAIVRDCHDVSIVAAVASMYTPYLEKKYGPIIIHMRYVCRYTTKNGFILYKYRHDYQF